MKTELQLVQMNESDPIFSEHNLHKCVLNFLRDIKKDRLIKLTDLEEIWCDQKRQTVSK